MKKYLTTCLCYLALCLPLTAQSIFDGLWTGSISMQGITLNIDIEIRAEDNSALISVPMQGIEDAASSALKIENDSIEIEFAMFRATYTGIYNAEKEIIEGRWYQGQSITLDLERTEQKTTFERPQTPSPPYPYDEEHVTIENVDAGINLKGTLTTPRDIEGQIPIVILVSGSGRQNRDSEILGHKPFLVIADFLTKNGIGVLRYDDRGVGESEGNFSKATSMDLASDAEAVFEYAKSLDIADKVGIIGHSEGGMIAPIIASRNKKVDFIISMAGPGIPIVELMTYQNLEVLRSSGMSETGLAITKKRLPQIYAIVNQDKEPRELFDTLIASVHGFYDELPEEDQVLLAPNKASYYMQLASTFFSDWFRYFLAYDPTESWQNVSCPTLAINGDKDIQIEGATNLAAIKRNLQKGKNPPIETELYAGLNHLFQPCNDCTLTEYSTIEITFDERVMERMKEFILAQ